jgi:colanic acid biosynthesis protein WcaH
MWISETLYQKIIKVMPIPCVDLIVQKPEGHILMLKRSNEPAKGQWWFPGGRVHFGELRLEAATRKLQEECGLKPCSIKEIGTYDVLLNLPDGNVSHGITTVFYIIVDNQSNLRLDKQSCTYRWAEKKEWLTIVTNNFLIEALRFIQSC